MVQDHLPYSKTDGPPSDWLRLDSAGRSSYPKSIALEYNLPDESRADDDPPSVWIHPESFFGLDICDPSI
ncbi:hypothetical protein EVG20_g1899 [Dentipellis fragilis]|uniref:Uncharacterized protein n=1 Tax=Dentipellis fragilis TaxID=205917 RepID=A0A4Y9Z8L0_9AGAM|nr:hypothetical protein EVG20_g1899 [Dentipellis fragilis]